MNFLPEPESTIENDLENDAYAKFATNFRFSSQILHIRVFREECGFTWSIHAYSWQESNFTEFSLQGAFEHIRKTRMTRKFQRTLPKAGTVGEKF
jgi:hypothetical protein